MSCWLPDRRTWCLLVALSPRLCHATDTVTASAFGAHFPSNESAYGGALTLQHTIADGGVVIGLGDSSFPMGSLIVFDLDGYSHPSDHVYFSAGLSLGNAQAEGHSSGLYKARAGWDVQWDPKWVFHVADQFIDLNVIHGHLFNAGVEFRPTPRWGLNFAGGYSVTGTVADRYGQIALNWYGSTHLYAGLVIGRTGYDPANLGEMSVVQRQFQAYAGASMPIAGGSLTLGAETLNLEGATRQTLRLGFAEPINQ